MKIGLLLGDGEELAAGFPKGNPRAVQGGGLQVLGDRQERPSYLQGRPQQPHRDAQSGAGSEQLKTA